MTIAFLGGGNMARALIGGLLGRGYDRTSICVVEVSAPARERLAAQHGVHVSATPDAATSHLSDAYACFSWRSAA